MAFLEGAWPFFENELDTINFSPSKDLLRKIYYNPDYTVQFEVYQLI